MHTLDRPLLCSFGQNNISTEHLHNHNTTLTTPGHDGQLAARQGGKHTHPGQPLAASSPGVVRPNKSKGKNTPQPAAKPVLLTQHIGIDALQPRRSSMPLQWWKNTFASPPGLKFGRLQEHSHSLASRRSLRGNIALSTPCSHSPIVTSCSSNLFASPIRGFRENAKTGLIHKKVTQSRVSKERNRRAESVNPRETFWRRGCTRMFACPGGLTTSDHETHPRRTDNKSSSLPPETPRNSGALKYVSAVLSTGHAHVSVPAVCLAFCAYLLLKRQLSHKCTALQLSRTASVSSYSPPKKLYVTFRDRPLSPTLYRPLLS